MTDPKNLKMIESVKASALSDLLEASDEEILRDLQASGFTIDDVHALKASVRTHAASLIREQRLPPRTRPLTVTRPLQTSRPPMQTVRSRVQYALQGHAASVRFRDARRQTDEDLMSLYDDMVELGLINPDADEG